MKGTANQALYQALLDHAEAAPGAQRQAQEGAAPRGHAVGALAPRAAQAPHERGHEHAHGTVDAYMLIIPPGSRSGKHRQLAEEMPLRGRGPWLRPARRLRRGDHRHLHWTPQKEVKRYEWEAGDVIYIPPNTASQHFNSDPARPVRLISAVNRSSRRRG
jgi:hypothetical protein